MLARVVREGSTPRLVGAAAGREPRCAATRPAPPTPSSSSNGRPGTSASIPCAEGAPGARSWCCATVRSPMSRPTTPTASAHCTSGSPRASPGCTATSRCSAWSSEIRTGPAVACRCAGSTRRRSRSTPPTGRTRHDLDHVCTLRRCPPTIDGEKCGTARRARRLGPHRRAGAARAAHRSELGGTRAGRRSDDRVRGPHSDQDRPGRPAPRPAARPDPGRARHRRRRTGAARRAGSDRCPARGPAVLDAAAGGRLRCWSPSWPTTSAPAAVAWSPSSPVRSASPPWPR